MKPTENAVRRLGLRPRPLVQIPPPRLSFFLSPSTTRSKGFLISGTRLTPSSAQFKQMISRIRRFAATSAANHLARRFCESSNARTAKSMVS